MTKITKKHRLMGACCSGKAVFISTLFRIFKPPPSGRLFDMEQAFMYEALHSPASA